MHTMLKIVSHVHCWRLGHVCDQGILWGMFEIAPRARPRGAISNNTFGSARHARAREPVVRISKSSCSPRAAANHSMRAWHSAIRQRLPPLCPCVWKARTQFLHFQNKQSSIGVCFRDHLVTKLRCSYKNLTRIPIAKIVAFTSKYGLYNRAMNLVLDGHTAMDFWRWVYPVGKTPDAKDCLHIQSLSSIDTANTQKDVQGLRPGWLTDRFLDMGPGRIGTLAGRPQERRRSLAHYVRSWSWNLPEGSLYDCGNGVLVPSPAFTFLQMASACSLPELIAYGDELCGLYSFDPSSKRGLRERLVPLATHQELSRYAQESDFVRGSRLAQRALEYVVEGSASPMETGDEMFICLPVRLGGYACPQLALNHRVDLDEHAQVIGKRAFCRADLCYPKIKLDLEHLGWYDHNGSDAFDDDRARVNALRAMGYEVIELTGKQVGDLRAFEEIVLYVARRVGKRIPKSALGATPARLALRDAVFGWNRRFGHPKERR